MSATEHAPPLQEVPGPSAFGGGAKRFLTLTWLLAATDFKLSYFETVFGYLWSLMRPLMTFGVLYVVFTKILRFGDQVPHYAALLLFNVMLFTFFSESTTRAVSCVVESENVVRKMQFPRLAIPTSVVLTGLFNLCLNLIVVLIFLLASGVTPRLTWLALPGLVTLLVALTAGVATLVAALYVRFRDIAPIWGVLSLVIFYASPILYPVEAIPHSLRFLLFVNPFAPLFEAARRLLVDPGAPTIVDAADSVWGVIGPSLVALAACAVGLLVFTRAAPRIAEEL
jgi:ABC-2 type transport system permease protein